jgi:hypothetical protein
MRRVIAIAAVLAIVLSCGKLRSGALQEALESCPTYGIVEADAYYEKAFSSDVVVFDLKEEASDTARRIDPVHLLMQFSAKVDLYSIKRIVLAQEGQRIFYIDSSDLRQLANSYDGGGRVWAFNHLPERVCTMSGQKPYGTWTGGWLGVLGEQAEDLNDLIERWTGY